MPGLLLSLGTGDVAPARNGNSVRFVANNSFAGAGEFFDVDRIYLTDMNPIPEPAGMRVRHLRGFASGFLASAAWQPESWIVGNRRGCPWGMV